MKDLEQRVTVSKLTYQTVQQQHPVVSVGSKDLQQRTERLQRSIPLVRSLSVLVFERPVYIHIIIDI